MSLSHVTYFPHSASFACRRLLRPSGTEILHFLSPLSNITPRSHKLLRTFFSFFLFFFSLFPSISLDFSFVLSLNWKKKSCLICSFFNLHLFSVSLILSFFPSFFLSFHFSLFVTRHFFFFYCITIHFLLTFQSIVSHFLLLFLLKTRSFCPAQGTIFHNPKHHSCLQAIEN